jgi:thiamine kinase-like enzyme
MVQDHNSLFVKQMGTDAVSAGQFQREINAYALFKNNDEYEALANLVPDLLDYDDENNIIITRLLPEAKNLSEYYMLTKNFDINLAKEQAHILSACHIMPDTKTDTSGFPKILPWVFRLNQFKAGDFFVGNEASTNIIQLIKDNNVLQNSLIDLAASWQYTHLIHGDIKWINFLATTNNENKLTQKLIDWELADMGDPLWDVAGLLQSYISIWLLGFDNNNPYSNELPDNMKPFDMRKLQPSAQALLKEYMTLQQYPEEYHSYFYDRVMRLTAARIIQTSVEGTTYHSKIEANYMRCIQLAFNIMKDPMAALDELFNIKLFHHV